MTYTLSTLLHYIKLFLKNLRGWSKEEIACEVQEWTESFIQDLLACARDNRKWRDFFCADSIPLLLPGTITVKTNEWKYVNDCFINIFSNIIGNDRQPLAV